MEVRTNGNSSGSQKMQWRIVWKLEMVASRLAVRNGGEGGHAPVQMFMAVAIMT